MRSTRDARHAGRLEEEQGIYRDEVMDVIGGLADISSDTLQILAILRGEDERRTMKKKWTPEEWRAYKKAREARIQGLRNHVERIKAELAAKRKETPA